MSYTIFVCISISNVYFHAYFTSQFLSDPGKPGVRSMGPDIVHIDIDIQGVPKKTEFQKF